MLNILKIVRALDGEILLIYIIREGKREKEEAMGSQQREKWCWVHLHTLLPHVRKVHHLKKEGVSCLSLRRMDREEALKKLHLRDKTVIARFDQFLHTSEDEIKRYYEMKKVVPFVEEDELYPDLLTHVYDPPIVLYTMGDFDLLKRPKIAIVGSRQATEYTSRALKHCVNNLIAPHVIVSGLAKGADALAHRHAIQTKLRTIAVVAHGFDYFYPKENEQLYTYMAKHELVVTEYPPYVKPKRWMFPLRNRIISGMSKGIIVTEAALKSGTMSTIDYGLDHGRTIWAIPGPIDSPLSEGPHRLIEEGAIPLFQPMQLVEDLRRK